VTKKFYAPYSAPKLNRRAIDRKIGRPLSGISLTSSGLGRLDAIGVEVTFNASEEGIGVIALFETIDAKHKIDRTNIAWQSDFFC
jgi:hypothetical protein